MTSAGFSRFCASVAHLAHDLLRPDDEPANGARGHFSSGHLATKNVRDRTGKEAARSKRPHKFEG
jgi:hypothetical protein